MQDPALIQDALYDAEEYLRAEVAAHPDKSEADVLELIASTYGAPEEVAAAYRDTEVKVKAALNAPAPAGRRKAAGARRFFGVFMDARAYTSLFYMLLALATGIVYFTFVVTGLSLSAGLRDPHHRRAVLPRLHRHRARHRARRGAAAGSDHRRAHAAPPGASRAAGGLVDAHRRDAEGCAHLDHAPVPAAHAAARYHLLHARRHRARIGLRLAIAPLIVAGLSLDCSCRYLPIDVIHIDERSVGTPHSLILSLVHLVLGVVILTLLMHAARGIARGHARLAKALLVEPGA